MVRAEVQVAVLAERQVEVVPVAVDRAGRNSGLQGVRGVVAATVKNSSQWIFRPIRQLALRCQKASLLSSVAQLLRI